MASLGAKPPVGLLDPVVRSEVPIRRGAAFLTKGIMVEATNYNLHHYFPFLIAYIHIYMSMHVMDAWEHMARGSTHVSCPALLASSVVIHSLLRSPSVSFTTRLFSLTTSWAGRMFGISRMTGLGARMFMWPVGLPTLGALLGRRIWGRLKEG